MKIKIDLKQIHSATHPAQLPKKDGAGTDDAKPGEAAREELLNALARTRGEAEAGSGGDQPAKE